LRRELLFCPTKNSDFNGRTSAPGINRKQLVSA
jgi:hypothetical protein